MNTKKNGNVFIEVIKNIKESIKDKVIDSGIFEGFNIDYIGPVDGHNIKVLINVFEAAKKKDGPIVIHVVTKRVRVINQLKKIRMVSGMVLVSLM